MAPGLLKGRFSDPKYHVHACELGDIIKTCLQFVITHNEINELEEKIITWLETYEKYYYQYKADRLCACPLTFHGLLHIGVRYDLADELSIFGQRLSGPSKSEHVYVNYPHAILRVPYLKSHKPDDDLRRKIARYFCNVLGKNLNQVLPLLPEIMPRWGKVRIVDGDSITAASTSVRGENSERNKSYVRFEIEMKKKVGASMAWVQQVCYGRLEQILVCQLPEGKLRGAFSGTTRLLAVLTPCSTGGKDAKKQNLTYTQMNAQIVTDLQSISAVIGRFETRGKWVIVDRTGGLIKPEFVPAEENEVDQPGDE
ncbi:hypothetical protein FB451DRAFT_1122402 [Mycena latifolia]|nr:hypothetical protein FB451DRAFT_1122402 [Mycena latifolia]